MFEPGLLYLSEQRSKEADELGRLAGSAYREIASEACTQRSREVSQEKIEVFSVALENFANAMRR